MKNLKIILGIFLVVLLGLGLRLLFIDKPEGLWNDEYVSYMISAAPDLKGFWSGIKSQCHMPLYYIYLRVTMLLFGQSDLVLRLSSVLTGVLAIPVMYFVGKEKDKKTGIYCAVFTAISSFLIYYSQEVRLYSLLFLISAGMLLYTLRLVKNPQRKNLVGFVIFNFLLLFTHTIGGVFVFFNLIFVSYKLYSSHKKIILKIWAWIFALALALAPLVFGIVFRKSFSQWWGSFSPSVFGFLMTDYFSPVLTNFTGAPPDFFYNFKSGFIIFALSPALIALSGLIVALKNKFNRELFYVVLGTLGVMTLAAIAGKLVFITKYSIEIYPVLIFLVCCGVAGMQNNILRRTLVTVFCVLNVFFLLVSPLSAVRLPRKEGHNLAAMLIKDADLKKGDVIILQYYNETRFSKYYDFSSQKVVSMNKGNFAEFMKPDVSYAQSFADGKNLFKDVFVSSDNGYFKEKLFSQVDLKQGQSVLVVSLNSVAFFNSQMLEKIVQNEQYYKQTPFLFLVFSYLKNETDRQLSGRYTEVYRKDLGSWSAVKFTKLHN